MSLGTFRKILRITLTRYGMLIGLSLVLLLLAGCEGEEYKPTAEQFFRDKLNLNPLPSGIADFRKANRDEPPFTSSKGYFKYRATPSFIAAILKHNKFFKDFKDDPSNQQIEQVQCARIYYYEVSIWADELSRIDMADKVCYAGIFLPYAHVVIYDPSTQMVDHFFYPIAP
jgi:hypothetical protein